MVGAGIEPACIAGGCPGTGGFVFPVPVPGSSDPAAMGPESGLERSPTGSPMTSCAWDLGEDAAAPGAAPPLGTTRVNADPPSPALTANPC